MSIEEFQSQMNEWGRMKVPFLFIADFELEKPILLKLGEVDSNLLLYDFVGNTNALSFTKPSTIKLDCNVLSFEEFDLKFTEASKHLRKGDSYLLNLTFRTQLLGSYDLKYMFYNSSAKYKIWLKDQFLFFSPETFIRIEDNVVKAFPMKGTIDASIENAEAEILNNAKEMAEHVTIVDLLRNDLSTICDRVEVTKFRYLESLKTNKNTLLQVSSEIAGVLKANHQNNFGDILMQLLPAGSICGAPKKKTVSIIQGIEQEKRGYYTGVAGIFDGRKFESCVMIRFIEQVNDQFYYRSGGGITSQSESEKEYNEMVNKIYVPVN